MQPGPEPVPRPNASRLTARTRASRLLTVRSASSKTSRASSSEQASSRHSRSRFPCFTSSKNELALRALCRTRWAWSRGRNTGAGGQGCHGLATWPRTASRERRVRRRPEPLPPGPACPRRAPHLLELCPAGGLGACPSWATPPLCPGLSRALCPLPQA